MNAERPYRGVLHCLAVAILFVVAVGSARAQGFAGLGTDAGGFAEVVQGRRLAFPADHGAHPDFRIEWWYLTANLTDAQGRRYGVQWTLFRQAMQPSDHAEGWASRQLWMGHAALTSATSHHFAERFARGGVGQAGVAAEPFAAWLDDWEMRKTSPSSTTLSPLRLTASAPDFSYQLELAGAGAPVLQGDAGFSRKSEGEGASYYYSQPDLKIAGTVTVDGKPIDVSGIAWFDHEWSSQPLASDETGWDWFSLHLDSGDRLMLFRLRHKDGRHFFAGTWIDPAGHTQQLAPADIALTPTATTRIAGRELPTGWQIEVPSHQLAIAVAPLNPQSWMDTRFKYWEGPISISGSQRGVGYLELTGY